MPQLAERGAGLDGSSVRSRWRAISQYETDSRTATKTTKMPP